jgi:hypothetical protein
MSRKAFLSSAASKPFRGGNERASDLNLGRQGAMNGAAVSYLKQSASLRLVKRPDQFEPFLDAMDHRVRIFAVGAVLDMSAFLGEAHDHLLEGPFLLRRVQVDRHRGAGAQRHQK